jgi:hypothetical protein
MVDLVMLLALGSLLALILAMIAGCAALERRK